MKTVLGWNTATLGHGYIITTPHCARLSLLLCHPVAVQLQSSNKRVKAHAAQNEMSCTPRTPPVHMDHFSTVRNLQLSNTIGRI